MSSIIDNIEISSGNNSDKTFLKRAARKNRALSTALPVLKLFSFEKERMKGKIELFKISWKVAIANLKTTEKKSN